MLWLEVEVMHVAGEVLRSFELAFNERLVDDDLGSDTAGQGDLLIPQKRPWVRLEMVLDRDDYKAYDAVLLTAEQKEILRGKLVKIKPGRGSTVVAWRFPSHLIQSGDYVVRLSGETGTGSMDDVASYSFRAVRK